MLNMVEARTPAGALLSLPLKEITEGFAINHIDGLGPVKATIVSSSFARLDGEQYHSARREARNLLLKVSLEPDWSISDVSELRNKLYRFFMPKRRVDLRFIHSSGLEVDISGRVESTEPDIFSEDPVVDISILCMNPDFYDRTVETVSGNTVSTLVETNVEYLGSVETGFRFIISPDRTLEGFTIYHRGEDAVETQMVFSEELAAGDVLTISTVPGSKSAKLANKTSLLYGVAHDANWHQLHPGDNAIRVFAEGAAVPWTIEYTTKYGGL